MTRRRRLRKRKEPRVRPAPDKKKALTSEARPSESAASGSSPSGPFVRKPLKPIGAEALKALREAIKTVKYPSDAAVVGGLMRMLKKPE